MALKLQLRGWDAVCGLLGVVAERLDSFVAHWLELSTRRHRGLVVKDEKLRGSVVLWSELKRLGGYVAVECRTKCFKAQSWIQFYFCVHKVYIW